MLAVRSAAASSRIAFGAMLLRDLVVLRKRLREFIPRTLVQPLLLCFVFLYVFPTIGTGVGGGGGAAGESAFATILVAGVVGLSIMFQGIQAVALPLVQEFGYTREIEDRVLAPLPVSLVALEKVTFGALQGLLAAVLVFPIAVRRACERHPHPPAGALAGAADADSARLRHVLGAGPDLRHDLRSAIGATAVRDHHPAADVPRRHVLRLDDARAGHRRQASTGSRSSSCVNPLIYINEGFRAALTSSPHMSLWAVYPALLGFCALFLWLGIRNFKRRVIG